MYTNKLNDIFKGVHFLDKTAGRRSATLPKNVPPQVFSIIFAQIYSFLHRVSQNFTNFCFPENLLVATFSGRSLRKLGYEWNSNRAEMAKYTCYFKVKIYCNINQKLQFTLPSAEAYSEPFQMSKWGDYLVGCNYFRKKLHLKCLTRLWIRYCSVNHKNNQTTEGKDTQHGNFKAKYISVLNHWKTFVTTLKRNQIFYLQS